MSTDYKGLIQGDHSVITIAKAIARLYGGEGFNFRFGSDSITDYGYGLGAGIDRGHFVLNFNEQYSDEVLAMRPWERGQHAVERMMHVFTAGECASDYKDVTTEPMTYVSLGHWGECKEIINALVAHFGGYINDEAGSQEWEPLQGEALEAANARGATRSAMIDARNAKYAAEAKAA